MAGHRIYCSVLTALVHSCDTIIVELLNYLGPAYLFFLLLYTMFSDRWCVPKCIWSNCSWCTHWNQVSIDQQGRQWLLLTFMSMLNRCLVLSYRLLPIFFFYLILPECTGIFLSWDNTYQWSFHGVAYL